MSTYLLLASEAVPGSSAGFGSTTYIFVAVLIGLVLCLAFEEKILRPEAGAASKPPLPRLLPWAHFTRRCHRESHSPVRVQIARRLPPAQTVLLANEAVRICQSPQALRGICEVDGQPKRRRRGGTREATTARLVG